MNIVSKATKMCILLVALFTVRVSAQETPAVVEISVVDSVNGTPISDARVDLFGLSTPLTGYTDAAGLLIVRDVVPQAYTVQASRSGYLAPEAKQFDAAADAHVKLEIRLQRLVVIASVKSAPSTSVTTERIADDSAERRVSGSLLSALGKLAGVSVNDTPGGGNAISLNGQDPNATAFSINGATVGGATTNVNLAQDLFSGASISFNPSFGYLGGTVNYQTLRPTLLPQTRMSASLGNYDDFASGLSYSASHKKLGIAVQATDAGMSSYINGDTFEDQSGLSYAHHGALNRLGEALYARYQPSLRSSISLSGISANQTNSPICSYLLTNSACGNGPGEVNRQSYQAIIGEGSIMMGNVQLASTLTTTDSSTSDDYATRLVLAHPAPLTTNNLMKYSSATLVGFLTLGHHSLRASYVASSSSGSLAELVGRNEVTNGGSQVNQEELISDSLRFSQRLSLSIEFDHSSAFGGTLPRSGGSSLTSNLTWHPNNADTLGFSVARGTAAPQIAPIQVLSDPSTAQFDCANQTSLVRAPSDVSTTSTSWQLTGGWSHSWARATVQLSYGAQVGSGLGRSLLLPFSAEPGLAADPAGYVNALSQYWGQPAACAGTPFDPGRIYVQQYISGIGQTTRYFHVQTHVNASRSLIIVANASLNSVQLSNLGSRFLAPGNVYRNSVQLFNVAPYSAGVTFDGIYRHQYEWLINAQLVGQNNGNNLPAYTTLNAGLVDRLPFGELSFVCTNLLDRDAFRFTRYQGINPIALVGGGTLAFPTSPIAPRSFSLSFKPRLGKRGF